MSVLKMSPLGFMAKILIIIFVCVIILLAFSSFEEKEVNTCEDTQQTAWSNSPYNCCMNCHKLNKNYFKHETVKGFLSGSQENCYCVKEEEVVQIY